MSASAHILNQSREREREQKCREMDRQGGRDKDERRKEREVGRVFLTYNVSQMVHGQSKSEDVGILVVGIDVFSVGQPHEVSLQLLSLGPIALLMLCLPQLPLLWMLVLDLCQ